MNRLQRELRRLYAPQPDEGHDLDSGEFSLVDPAGRVRAMVLELARPADWNALWPVWNGVQHDLKLPAPAIAVSGTDGYQLWFSLAQPLPAAQAVAFLESLRLRYLSDIKAPRIAWMPTVDPASPGQIQHASLVPALQGTSGLWSAFVAPDLAPVFADEPWLDIPPNLDGQSDLLARLESISALDLQFALERLSTGMAPGHSPPAPGSAAMEATKGTEAAPINARSNPTGAWSQPKRFLLDVMNDDAVALALRIEAAKALLPWCNDSRREGPE
jgi:hypothetical protein